MDLQAIREKLQQQRQSYASTPSPPVDWGEIETSPQSSPVAAAAASPHLAQLATTVAQLKQRSRHQTVSHESASHGSTSHGSASHGSASHEYTTSPAPLPPPSQPDSSNAVVSTLPLESPPDLMLHWQRLRSMADRINDLSQQQEQAMLEMKRAAERVAWIHRQQGRGEIPLCDYATAILAQVNQDDQGAYVLSYRPADLYQPEREADDVARTLRDRTFAEHRQASQPGWDDWGLSTLLAEPWSLIRDIWFKLRPVLVIDHRSSNRRRSASLGWTEICFWFAGAVIARLALDLVLAAYPGLWSFVVVAVIACTTFALYRATLAPRIDITLAYRTLLIVAGLIVGGRF
ncbi:hypothetical protein XM38_041050 [Halomicronema hongdechloris C2206]|uniref:Uncharacterized protein n=2 Tax=Halomicronema hongdechloris TaxID=1209493 RepID=A0A1Z3HS57_9CYAN|nr:hypothetical protein XM38_041050 [Halomicronema hongdechloris C2206]